jgi:hypothetical protein
MILFEQMCKKTREPVSPRVFLPKIFFLAGYSVTGTSLNKRLMQYNPAIPIME